MSLICPFILTDATAKAVKPVSLEESLNIMMTGFLRGATSFLKTDIIKGGSGVNREVRVGVTHVCVISYNPLVLVKLFD